MDEKLETTINEDGSSARCFGLTKRTARKIADNSPVSADYATKKDGPFYCPACLSDVIVRKCTEKINHFAHQARKSPLLGKKDQQLHNQSRDEICGLLQKIFPEGNWGTERKIMANLNKGSKERIPDISGRIGGKPIAIEVQCSSYTLNRIYEKTCDYHKLGIYVLWILPLKEELGTKPFRPRLFEKFLHSMYYGRVYYYTVGSGTILQPVHFSPAKRYIEGSEWYEEGGEHRFQEGYFLTYKTLKSPKFGERIDIAVDFKTDKNPGFSPKNVKKEIPECKIFMDGLKVWWDKDEYKNIKTQVEVTKIDRMLPEDYDYEDEYDDYNES